MKTVARKSGSGLPLRRRGVSCRLEGLSCHGSSRRGAPRRGVARRRASHGGFTLIEMLIVIGIILILISIGVTAYRSMERTAAINQTKATLGAAEGMLKNLSGAGMPYLLEGASDLSPTPVFPGTLVKISSPGDMNNSGSRANLLSTGSQKLPAVMRVLASNPQNKSSLANMQLVAAPSGSAPFDTPFLADAWGNPIIYVPAGGLTGINLEAGSNQTITSTGTVGSVQNRGFFASAGPDGDFSKGDDNIYSFQVK